MNTPGDFPRPHVLFVCNTNGGKPQMAAALFRQGAGEAVHVQSAGPAPAHHGNGLAAEVMAANRVDMQFELPSELAEERLSAADRVIIMGQTRVQELEGVTMECWVPRKAPTSLANDRERMEFMRSDLEARVAQLDRDIVQAKARDTPPVVGTNATRE